MTHYPPIGPNLEPSRASLLLENMAFNTVYLVIFTCGSQAESLRTCRAHQLFLTAADYLQFKPLQIL